MDIPFRPLFVAGALALVGAVHAQTGDGNRGNTPPGTSQDGSRPADGAIVGGSIKPGERAGQPDKGPTARGVERCGELTGTLREQCLEQENRSGAGGTGLPDASSRPSEAPSNNLPPPQNPRR